MYAEHITNFIMATCGLSHTKNTRVGNDFIRGVSGCERKRVSICQVALSGVRFNVETTLPEAWILLLL